MCVVNKYGFIPLNKGISKVLRMVNTTMMLMVATIGPMEFSANMDSGKPNAATVSIAIAAKPNAAMYRQKNILAFLA